MSESRLGDYRGKIVSMIFQEPMLAFDPVYTIGEQIEGSVDGPNAAAARKHALEMLERVRIPSPERRLDACTRAVPKPQTLGPGHAARCIRVGETVAS